MIVEKVLEAKERKIKQFPVRSNRASELGIPCTKYHVLNREKWQEKTLHNAHLQSIFDLGRDMEEIVMKELREAGFDVREQQRAFEWKEHEITGTIDGKIVLNGDVIPLEIKSCSPYVFQAINGINDLKRGKYPYLRKYPVQLNLYMLMGNHPRGVFLFKNKSTGQLKEIFMDLDYELGEQTLKMVEQVNQHLKDGTMPEPINDDFWCNDCTYVHVCLPAHIGKEVEIDTSNLSELLDRMESLKDAKKEYEELDDQVKQMVEGREKVLAGAWLVIGKWYERKSYDIPAEIKAAYEKITKCWRRTIRKA